MGSRITKAVKGEAVDVIFKTYSRGVVTCRDAWAYNFDQDVLAQNMDSMIETYNEQVLKWTHLTDREVNLDDFVVSDDRKISWSEALKRNLPKRKNH